MEYKILQSSSLDLLTETINEYINDGWQLHGTIFRAERTDQMYRVLPNYCQAIIKQSTSYTTVLSD